MKKYKNIKLSFGAYAIALLIMILWNYIVPQSPKSVNWTGLILFTLFIITGIFFGFKSNHQKESTWLGYLMILIGFLVLLSPLIIYYISWRI